MKIVNTILFIAFLALVQNGEAQGFVNLDFDSATIVPISGDSYHRVDFDSAFPGWTGYTGTNVETLALYNTIFLDSSGIGIFDTNSSLGTLIQGCYTAMLEAGLRLGSTGQSVDTSLSQTGLIPFSTQSLLFYALGNPNSFSVTLNGQTLSLTPLSTISSYVLYGADISAWANQTATLSFTVFAQQPHVDNNILYLDSIQFSLSPIPEPSEFALATLGALLLGFRRKK